MLDENASQKDEKSFPRSTKKTCRRILQETLEENLRHPKEEVINLTTSAMFHFISTYYPQEQCLDPNHPARKASEQLVFN